MSKVYSVAVLIIGAIVALPFILLGIAIGATILTVKAVVKMGEKKAPVVKSVGAKEAEPVIDKPIVDFNKFPVGRMDKGGTC